jgi:hypothetical protein
MLTLYRPLKAQDFRVRMYDTSNPYDWKYYKVSGKILV